MPLSGSEPEFEPELFRTGPKVQKIVGPDQKSSPAFEQEDKGITYYVTQVNKLPRQLVKR